MLDLRGAVDIEAGGVPFQFVGHGATCTLSVPAAARLLDLLRAGLDARRHRGSARLARWLDEEGLTCVVLWRGERVATVGREAGTRRRWSAVAPRFTVHPRAMWRAIRVEHDYGERVRR